MPRLPIICLVGGGFSTQNFGVSALTLGILRSLLRSWPEVKFILVDYGKGAELESIKLRIEGKELEVEKILFRFSKKFLLRNNIIRVLLITLFIRMIPIQPLRKVFLKSCLSLRKMASADLICSIAGGDSFSNLYGFRQLLYVSLPVVLGLWLNKPVVLLPQTYGPFKGKLAKILAKYIFRRAKLIYSRDQESLKVVEGLIGSIKNHTRFGYDMGFALETLPPESKIIKKIEEMKLKGSLVGLNVSGLLFMERYRRTNMFRLKVNYKRLINNLLQNLIFQKGLQVILIPHVWGKEVDSESDEAACKRIYLEAKDKYRGSLHYLHESFTPHTIKYVIGQCDFFIGSRMHACIAALSQYVPTIALAYSQKFAGVLKSIDLGELVIDLRKIDEKGVQTKVDELITRKHTIRQQLRMSIPKICESVLNLFSGEDIKQLIH